MTEATAKKGLSTGVKIAIGCGTAIALCFLTAMLLFGVGVAKVWQRAEKRQDKPAAEGVASGVEESAAESASATVGEEAQSIGAADAAGDAVVGLGGPRGQTPAGAGAGAPLEGVPDWVPIYPNAETRSTYNGATPEGIAGTINLVTGDSAREVTGHYETWFEENGYEVGSQTSYARGDQSFASMTGVLAGRTIDVGLVEAGGECEVTIGYESELGAVAGEP